MKEDILAITLAIFGCTGFWQLLLYIVQHHVAKKSVEHKALVGLLHDRIYELCHGFIDAGFVATDDYKNLMALYEPYVGLGGNSTAKMLKEEVDKLPKKERRTHYEG